MVFGPRESTPKPEARSEFFSLLLSVYIRPCCPDERDCVNCLILRDNTINPKREEGLCHFGFQASHQEQFRHWTIFVLFVGLFWVLMLKLD